MQKLKYFLAEMMIFILLANIFTEEISNNIDEDNYKQHEVERNIKNDDNKGLIENDDINHENHHSNFDENKGLNKKDNINNDLNHDNFHTNLGKNEANDEKTTLTETNSQKIGSDLLNEIPRDSHSQNIEINKEKESILENSENISNNKPHTDKINDDSKINELNDPIFMSEETNKRIEEKLENTRTEIPTEIIHKQNAENIKSLNEKLTDSPLTKENENFIENEETNELIKQNDDSDSKDKEVRKSLKEDGGNTKYEKMKKKQAKDKEINQKDKKINEETNNQNIKNDRKDEKLKFASQNKDQTNDNKNKHVIDNEKDNIPINISSENKHLNKERNILKDSNNNEQYEKNNIKESFNHENNSNNNNEDKNDSSNHSQQNSKNENSNSFIITLILKYNEFRSDINPFIIKINTLLINNLINFHIILKEKLNIPYPVDLIIFTAIGYILASIILSMFGNVKLIFIKV